VRDVAPVGDNYLVGVADGASALIIIRVDGTLTHASIALDEGLGGVVFDAAFAYDEGVYVLGSDGHLYLVEVDLSAIDDDCWAASSADAACGTTAALAPVATLTAGSGSGTNCAGTLAARPSPRPTLTPKPSSTPTTAAPLPQPTTARPVPQPTPGPSSKPTPAPTPVPGDPTAAPVAEPTARPTPAPTPVPGQPTPAPIAAPTARPSLAPQLVSTAVVVAFDETDYSEDLGRAVGDAIVAASPSVEAYVSVTFATTRRRRLAAETRMALTVLVVTGGVELVTLRQELSDAVATGALAAALMTAVAAYPALGAVDASGAVQTTASLAALAVSVVVPTAAPTPGAAAGGGGGGGADAASGSLQIILGVVFAAVALCVCGGAKWYHDRERAADARRLERWDDVEKELRVGPASPKEPSWAASAPPEPSWAATPAAAPPAAGEPSWAPVGDQAWPAAAPSDDDDDWPAADDDSAAGESGARVGDPAWEMPLPPPGDDGLPLPPPPAR